LNTPTNIHDTYDATMKVLARESNNLRQRHEMFFYFYF